MRAKTINEVQNFERGIDPKRALDIGVKNKFIDLLPKSSQLEEEFKRIEAVLLDPKTEIIIAQGTIPIITIRMKESKMNYFFFQTLKRYLNSHHPRKLYIDHDQTTDNELVLYYQTTDNEPVLYYT